MKNQKILTITWQRLVSDGDTCPRCRSTENELDKAILKLNKKLSSRRIKVILKKTELTPKEFKQKPIESNRILFNNEPLENLLSAATGQSPCCNVCGNNKCRTLELDGKSHEVITSNMIIKAGLIAASKIWR